MSWLAAQAVLKHFGVPPGAVWDPDFVDTAKALTIYMATGYEMGDTRLEIVDGLREGLQATGRIKDVTRAMQVAAKLLDAYDHAQTLPEPHQRSFAKLIELGVTVEAAAKQVVPPRMRTQEGLRHRFADDPPPGKDPAHVFFDPEWE